MAPRIAIAGRTASLIGLVGLVGLVGLAAGAGRAEPAGAPTPPEVLQERDALLDKIVRGADYERSVARFVVLHKEDVARREAAKLAQKQQAEQRENDLKALKERQKTLDYLVAEHCLLRTDPSQPSPPTSSFLRGDWGKVVRKQAAVVKGRTAFDDDVPITYYLIQGIERTYSLSSKSPTLYLGKGLQAEVGELVLVCYTGFSTHGSGGPMPEEFRQNVVSQGFAARIAAPPLITKKGRWNPLHLTGESAFRIAIDRVEWRYEEGRPVLGYIHVLRDLGGGRFEIAAERTSYMLEVPEGLKNRALMQPGKYLWAIMSTPRFDKSIKKLVMRAEDLEAQYLQAVD